MSLEAFQSDENPSEVINTQEVNQDSVVTDEEELTNVDYVLVYNNTKSDDEQRKTYEKNLKRTGLVLHTLHLDHRHFVKIYAPDDVLLKFAEILKLRLPLKDHTTLTEQFSRSRCHLFNTTSKKFFTTSVRYMIINFILEKQTFDPDAEVSDNENSNFGITKLIVKDVYTAAYPLHDPQMRDKLLENWATVKRCLKPQPLDDIKDYYGTKIALYFAWLSYYCLMLIPASVIGVTCMIYGTIKISTKDVRLDICNDNKKMIMCPQCDKYCDYWNLQESCTYSTINYLFDNCTSLVFAVAMSLWCSVYLNLWNRYSAELIHRWRNTSEDVLDDEQPTAQYLKSANIYDKKWSNKLPKIMFSYAVVLFWISIVIGVMIGIMFYRISMTASEQLFGEDSRTLRNVIVSITGGIFDLISILLLDYLYNNVATWLTEREIHRTQTQFEESLMWKLYIFWFINYYSSFFYIAFIKGRFIGSPRSYNRIFGYRQEECGPGGCIVELFIQIAVVMIGDLTYNNVIEYLVPYLKKKCRSYKVNKQREDDAENNSLVSLEPCVQEHKLLYWSNKDISLEYLEMVLQYGFVTLFVIAFPLAPLLALVNNTFEIRMDARKLLQNYRRPTVQDTKDIGIWLEVMNVLSYLSIITNACIIAFTTDFIPILVFDIFIKDESKNNFLNYTLAVFDVNDFEPQSRPSSSSYNVTFCRYPQYRNPPNHEDKYELSKWYWHILAVKLIFVLLYQNIVFVLKFLVKWIVPEMPGKLKAAIINDALRTQRIIMMQEIEQSCNVKSDFHSI